MHQQSAHSVETSRAPSRSILSSFYAWFAIALLGVAALWPAAAAAAPSAFCPTLNMSVAHSGSQTININHCHGGFGIAAGSAATTHGTRTVGVQSGTNLPLTYTHNGNGATSDTFVIQDDNGDDITVTVAIGAASTITIGASPAVSLVVGVPFSTSLSGSGGTAPYTFSLDTALPPGLSLSGNTISGTPTQRGAYAFTVRATDNGGDSGVRTFSGSAANPTLTLSPSPPPAAAQGMPYSVTFAASGGVPTYSFAHEVASGPLPPGLTLSGATLSGTPTTTGTFTFGIRVTDTSTGTGSYAEIETVTLQVIPPPTIVVNPATVPEAATVGIAYSETFAGSGGTGPYTFAISVGALPAGLSLNASSGALTGTPTAAGTFNFTVRATDANGFSGTRAYTLVSVMAPIAIGPPTLPNGMVAAAYSQDVSAFGGIAPYSYAITAGSLPAGISLSTTGTLSGTPSAGGTFNFTVTATSNSTGAGAPHTGSRAYALVVDPPTITLPPTTLTNGTQGVAYSATLNPASGGTSPHTYALIAGALPPGISLSAAGMLSGTPSASGTFNFAVVATDSSTGSGPYSSAPRGYSLQVVNIPPVTNPVAQNVAYNSGANPITLNITGGVPTSVAIYTAPANGTAIASGLTVTYQPNPGYAGPDSFTYTATNSAGTSGPDTVTITVDNPIITVVAGDPLTAQIGVAYSQTFTWNGGVQPFAGYSVGGLPAGLAISGTTANSVTVSGMPTEAGSFTLNPSATDSSTGTGPFTVGGSFTLSVSAPTLTLMPSAGTLSATSGSAYSQAFVAGGGTPNYTYAVSAGALPAGLSLDATTGVLSGTPTVTGLFTFSVRATDSSTGAGAPFARTQNYVLQVAAPVIAIAPATLPGAQVGSAYSQALNASGGAGPYSYSITAGALPAGLSLSGNTLSGTPTATGTFNFTVTATDINAQTGSRAYSLTVGAPTLAMTPAAGSLPMNYGMATTINFGASGGTASYSYSLAAGSLPVGVSFSSAGVLSGTPTVPGNYNITVRVTDASTGAGAPFSLQQNYTIVVATPAIAIDPPTIPNGTAGTAYSVQLSSSGGVAPYSYSLLAGALPIGMSFSSAGLLSGVPRSDGNFSLTVRSTDDNGQAVSRVYTFTIAPATVAITPASLPGGTVGVAYSQSLGSSGGIAPYTYSIVSGSLPPGMAFSSAGVLSGTPVLAGSYSFVVRSTDDAGYNTSQNYTVVIAEAMAIDPPTIPNGTAGTAYSVQLSSSGGVAPYSYSLLAGALPIGMSFSSAGLLSGVPRSDGNFSLTVRATDDNGQTVSRVYTFTIAPATVAITPASLPGGTVGVAYSQSLGSSGGIAPYTYSIVSGGSLPPGMAFSSAGVLSGTPVLAGSYSFVVRSTDDAGYNTPQNYTVVIADAVPVAVDDSATTPSQQAVTIPVTANDAGIITSVAVASAPTNGTATVSGLNVVYTPAGSFFGADSFTYNAIGPGGTSVAATVSVTVTALPVPVGQPRTATTLAGQPVTIDTTVGATGGPFTGVTVVTPPATGTTSVSGTSITYTPLASASGSVSIVYTLNNAYGASAAITSTVTVNPLPVAVSRQVSAVAGVSAVVELTTDATGGPFTGANLVSLSPAGAGTATIVASGSGASAGYRLTFTPATTFAGTATATFTLSNAFAVSVPATIDFDVVGRPDPTEDVEVMGLLGAQTATARRFATTQIGNFQRRMEGMHDGGSGARFDHGLSFGGDPRCQDERRHTPGSDCRQLAMRDVAAPADNPTVAQGSGDGSGLTIWTGGSLNSGDRDSRSGSAGFDFETSGISAGIDTRVNQAFAFGGGIGYGRDNTDVGRNGTRSDGKSYTLAVYGSFHPGKSFFVDGLLGYQWLSFDSRRYVAANDALVHGQRDGKQWFASLSLGGDYQRDRLQLTPYARLDIARATLDGYTESSDPIHALRYQDQDVDTTTTSLGLRMEYRVPVSYGMFSPQLRLEYQHDFQDDSSVTMSYADLLGGPLYRGEIEGLERNRFVFGLGALLQTERDFTLRFEYRGLLGSDGDSDHGVQLNLEKQY